MNDNGAATVINDRYEVHKRIGRGGMADVFSARDLLLDRQVAMKVLFPEFAVDENFVERFRREAQSAANLSHPNIVSVYDWGKFEGTYFIAMEEVQGQTLADVLKANKQLTAKQAGEIAGEVAAALGFAHDGGLAHRDIKPANILIGSNGQVKVADFGIARAMNAPTEDNLTQVGSVMGTATYFSPEQAQGAQPDPRSDLYSLGIVMYEMVSGKPPFSGENPVSIAYKQVHDAPQPLVQLIADVPRPFEAIVAKLLAKDPKLRYPSANALRDDLRRFRNDEPVQALAVAADAQGASTSVTAATAVIAASVATGATTATPTVPPRTGNVPQTGMYEAGYPPGASPDAMYYDAASSRTGWYALAAFVALIALIVGGVLVFQSLNQDDLGAAEPVSFELADYTNRPRVDVVTELADLGLNVRTDAEENNNFGIDFVIRTEPPAGTIILEGQEIVVFFNPDPQVTPIPNVVGIPIEDARVQLEAAGFNIGTETIQQTDQFEQGTVLSMNPPAGTQANAEDFVDLVIAGPPSSVSVPGFLIGQTEQAAIDVLEGEPYSFVVTVVRIPSNVDIGTVIEIAPAANTLVPRGGDVTLTVSDGPQPISVPTVSGLTEGRARNQLTDAGLTVLVNYVEVAPGSIDDGRVKKQDLSPGSLVPPGTLVTLTVGRSTVLATTLPPVTAPPTTEAPPTTAAPPTTEAPPTTAAPETPIAPPVTEPI
ncbi:Stk1 family PASTA domain-containing Ser/Thr kinase [uncultured Ilumatobacter sp.]|uniref:Stk1 family PASTA domain-containing Ser/Thr kinase n=1 Tax=uncultured Ilumatobacter sp. TaxID=879968 RepID=UPI00374F896A